MTTKLDDDGMSTLDVLTRSRKRIANKRRWVKKSYAVGRYGRQVGHTPEEGATRWCALGALECENILWHSSDADPSCLNQELNRNAVEALAATSIADKREGTRASRVIAVNDILGHTETLRMFDEAIETLKGA